MDVPDKVLIYDTVGLVVGLQSGAPETDFVSGDCTKNDFYVRDTINGIQAWWEKLTSSHSAFDKKSFSFTLLQFCLATYYFTDPRAISNFAAMDANVEEIHLQRGDSWEAEGSLIRVPKYYSELEANPDQWVLHRYFLV